MWYTVDEKVVRQVRKESLRALKPRVRKPAYPSLAGDDCFNGAYIGTGTAIGTGVRINYVDIVSLADGPHRAFILAASAGYTFIGDCVRHVPLPSHSQCIRRTVRRRTSY